MIEKKIKMLAVIIENPTARESKKSNSRQPFYKNKQESNECQARTCGSFTAESPVSSRDAIVLRAGKCFASFSGTLASG